MSIIKKEKKKQSNVARCWWLTPVILATQEAEIRRIMLHSQPQANISRPYLKETHYKKKGLRE
jgi:hypothetical protein